MKPEKDYETLISDEGIVIFILAYKKGEPKSPVILYDGGAHAVFYRREDEVILFDYLNQELVLKLVSSSFAVIMETTKDGKDVFRDYSAAINIVKPCSLTEREV